MCIYTISAKPICIKPFIAYKVMWRTIFDNTLKSFVVGELYCLGETYEATIPAMYSYASRSPLYDKGFHAYTSMTIALERHTRRLDDWGKYVCLVRVELSDVTFVGFAFSSHVMVANKCKFVDIVDMKLISKILA